MRCSSSRSKSEIDQFRVRESVKYTHGCEDTGSVVADRVLTAELLKQEDDGGDDEADEVPRSEEGFLPSQPSAGLSLLNKLGLDFCHLSANVRALNGSAAVVGKVLECQFTLSSVCEVSRRLLGPDKTNSHDSSGDELNSEGNAPDTGSLCNVLRQTD